MSLEDFNCIAVDMGAGSIRIMLGSLDEKGMSYREVHRFSNEIIHVDGRDRWDMEEIWRGILQGIGKAVELSGGEISSIGVDSWGVDFVLLDEEGHLLEVPVAYRDKRTEGMEAKWDSLMSREETFRRTGINFYIFNSLFQLLSIKDSPLFKKAASILFLPGYILHLLSGKRVNELSIASTSQLLGIGGKEWDPDIMDLLGLRAGKMGKLVEPGSRLGPVRIPEAGSGRMETVAVCGHDTASVVAALPVEDPDFAYISAGTWCVLGIESAIPVLSKEALTHGFTNERGFGSTYRVLKNIVGLWLVQGLKKHLPENTGYEELEAMALGAGDVLQVIDPEDQRFYHPEDMKEAFDQCLDETGQTRPTEMGGYLRCAYDSLCFSFRHHLEVLEKLSGKSIRVLHMVGGGSQSDLLNQRVADICQREVLAGPVEGATLGNILVQALAMGVVRNLEDGRRLIRESFPIKNYAPGLYTNQLEARYQLYLKHKQA